MKLGVETFKQGLNLSFVHPLAINVIIIHYHTFANMLTIVWYAFTQDTMVPLSWDDFTNIATI